MKNVRFGVAALAMGAFFGVGLPVRADQLVWVRAQQLDFWRAKDWCHLDLTHRAKTRNLPP